MSDFVPQTIRETPDDFGTWSRRLCECVNKIHLSRRQTRIFCKRDKEQFPWSDWEPYHCKWCGNWHMAEKYPDRKKERKRHKLILAMRREEMRKRYERFRASQPDSNRSMRDYHRQKRHEGTRQA